MPKPWVFPACFGSLVLIVLVAGFLAGSWHAPDKIVRVKHQVTEAKLDSQADIRAIGEPADAGKCAELGVNAVPPGEQDFNCEIYAGTDFVVVLVTQPAA